MDVLVELLGESPPMEAVRVKLRRLLERPRAGQRLPPVLLQGETGTGKGLVARLLHRYGPRAQGPFVDVNCAAIPEALLEAELFGFERGAFTDAGRAKPGLFQTAHGGVLFLDEISLMAASAQAKLLTAIESRVVRRLGSTRAEPADVWLISATNADLEEAARARRFRADLYHRLAILTIELPPLRARNSDVVTLAQSFLDRACAEYGLPTMRLDVSAERRLLAYSWPGNVRELGNVIERAALLSDGLVLAASALELSTEAGAAPTDRPSPTSRDTVRRERLVAALTETGWNISRTAVQMGVARNTVYAYLDRFGLRPEHPDRSGSNSDASAQAATGAPASLTPSVRLEWEPRNLALLRVELNDKIDPSETDAAERWSLAGRTLELAVTKVLAFGGRVEDMTPTGLVAAFGLEPTEDAPRRAAHAALAIHRAIQRQAAGVGERRLPVAIGLHVSSFLVGQMATRIEIDGQAKRAQWAILDELLHRTAPGQTTTTDAAAPFLERRFELAPVETGHGTIHHLTGQERRGLGLWGVMTPFVGRREERDLLRHRSTLAASGHGQVIAIVGDAGVGKSRLIYEFARARRVDGWRVLETTAVAHGRSMSYLPVIALLKDYFAILDGDDVPAVREKVATTLGARDLSLHQALPALLALLDVSTDEAPWRTLDPPQRRQRILDAVRSLLLGEAREHPILLIVEDLHWVDGETQALLDSLVDSLQKARLLLLVSYRREYQHAWASKPSYTQLPLEVLPGEQAAEFLSALVGEDTGLAPLKQRLVKRGNPFFLEETIRTLVESQALEGRGGDYRLTRPLASLEIPLTVQAILTARIDRLPPGDKQLLQTAAVIGKDVPLVLLHAIARMDDAVIRAGLARLQAAEFVYEAALSREPVLTFKHALTHEVVYGGLLPERRRELHARVVEAIERLHRDRLGEQTERLAHHALHGGLREQAVPYLQQAAAKAVARSASREAVSYLQQALGVVGQLPENPKTSELAIDLRLDLQVPLNTLGEIEQLLDYLREAEPMAEALGDLHRMGRIAVYLAFGIYNATGHLDQVVTSGERALAIARTVGDLGLEAQANFRLGQAYNARGEYPRAIAAFKRNVDTLVGDLQTARFGMAGLPAVMSRASMGWCLAQLGEFPAAMTVGEEAVRVAEAADDRIGLVLSQFRLGLIHVRRGDPEQGLPWLERSLDGARSFNFEIMSVFAAYGVGEARAACGDIVKALPLLEQAAERAASLRFAAGLHAALGALSEGYLLAGRPADARHTAERMLELTRATGNRYGEAEALRMLGEGHALANPAEASQAEASYRQALTIAERIGTRPLVAHCHLGLGKLYRRTGKSGQAQEHLGAATTMYREMEMRYWLEQAEAESSESSWRRLSVSAAGD